MLNNNYLISQCSILEDEQIVKNIHFTEISELGSARCLEIHQRLTYHIPLGGVFTGLKMIKTRLSSTTIAGFIDRHRNW